MSNTRFYSVIQLAEMLASSQDTIRALIASGKLAASDISAGSGKKRWRVSSDDLETFLVSRRNIAPQKPVRRRKRESTVTEFY